MARTLWQVAALILIVYGLPWLGIVFVAIGLLTTSRPQNDVFRHGSYALALLAVGLFIIQIIWGL